MFNRRLWIILGLAIFGVSLIVQAQDNPPLSPATVDAAVSTLIAQTQQPQMMATQTIHAALSQALTATAQSTSGAPASTEPPFDASKLTVSGTTDFDLLAGPAGTAAYLAPDGEHFAYYAGKSICIYEADQQPNCTDLSQMRSRYTESIRWSPDSRYLAFTEDFFRRFDEPDIWVLDTTTHALTDITDDGTAKFDTSNYSSKTIDIAPGWTQDNQIVFLRYSHTSDETLPPEIHQIAPDGSGEKTLGTLNDDGEALAIYSLDVGHNNTLVYGFASQNGSPSDGVWISDLDGTNARQLTHETGKATIRNVQMSPDDHYVLVNALQKDFASNPKPEASRMYVVDATSGQVILIDPDRYVSGAGWALQGSALVYITQDIREPGNNPVFLTNMPGVAGQQLTSLQGYFNIATPLLQVMLTWGTNNTILLSHSPGTGIVLVHLQ